LRLHKSESYYKNTTTTAMSALTPTKKEGELPSRGIQRSNPWKPDKATASMKTSILSDFTLRKPTIESEYKKSMIVQPLNLSKVNKNVQDLTVNKLRFGSVGLLGRTNEIETLQACADRVLQPNQETKEMIMISGYSGTGKSTLAMELKKRAISKKRRVAFLASKFDQYQVGEPFSAILEVFGELCRRVVTMNSNAEEKSSICDEIAEQLCSELQDEVHLLAKIIPYLGQIITSGVNNSPPDASNLRTSLQQNYVKSDARRTRLLYAFRVFTRIMSSFFQPLIILLDDLQWADVSSLEIIELLVSDTQNKNPVMIIGCYRSNEVDKNHPLLSMQRNLMEKKEASDKLLQLTQIELDNLGENEVNRAIMALLSIDDATKTRELADICHKRTEGNPFFLVEFVKVLEEEGLLSFHLGLFRWKWDAAEIASKTASTQNVVDLLQVKMRKLSLEAQGFLQCAACLGSSFTSESLGMIWQHQNVFDFKSISTKKSTNELLAEMTGGHYLEMLEIGKFRWAHDKVQQAASSLTEEGNLASFRRNIGEIWYRELGEDNLETCLFDVANLINAATESAINIEYAEINLKAAKKARGIAAFESCSEYALKGISMLPSNAWDSHPDVTLKLFSLAAEAEGYLGHLDKMESYYNEVLSQTSISTLEKKNVYMAKLQSMANTELRYEATVDLCLGVLEDLGCKIPRGKVSRTIEASTLLHQTVKMIKQTPIETFDTLPELTDPSKLATMDFLHKIADSSCLTGEKPFLLMYKLAVTRVVQTTLLHGSFDVSGVVLAMLGWMAMFVLGDIETARYIGERALQVQEKSKSEVGKAKVFTFLSTFIFYHVKPLQSSLKPLLESYQSGMRTGDKSYAMWCLLYHNVFFPFMIGKPLKLIEEQCQASISLMLDLKELEQAACLRSFWQLCLNLMGLSDNTVEFVGKAMNENNFAGSHFSRTFLLVAKSIAYNLFVEYELGANQGIEKGLERFFKVKGGIFVTMMFMYHQALSLYAAARNNNKKKGEYRTQANHIRKKLISSLKSGNPNIIHYVSLLNAENAAVENKKNQQEHAIKLYKSAIITSARGGYAMDAGLAHERFADFLLNKIGDTQEAKYHIEEAIRCYNGWGAMGKVNHLRDHYQEILTGLSAY